MSTINEEPEDFQYRPIGIIKSPFKQKFAIPRQPNLVPQAKGEIVLYKEFAQADALRELERFSHLWVLFHFHATADQGWTPTVQPPRLGGKEKVGVFASRSPFRPNPVGLSVVKNLGIRQSHGALSIGIGGIDLLDETPVLDIKPYLPYADCLTRARGGFAESAPGSAITVQFTSAAEATLADIGEEYSELRQLITAVLQQDPRPAWRVKKHDEKRYGMSLYDLNIKWHMGADIITVDSIEQVTASN